MPLSSPHADTDLWYRRTWVVVTLFVLFWPLGLFLLWKNPNFGKPAKVFGSLLALGSVLLIMGSNTNNSKKASSSQSANLRSSISSPKMLNDAAALDKKYDLDMNTACDSGADDYLRSVARYQFKWEKTGWLETKFDSYLTTVSAPGDITAVSNKAMLQNGFGAFRRIELFCSYDTQNDKVLRYWVRDNNS